MKAIPCPYCETYAATAGYLMDAHLLLAHPQEVEPLLASNEPLGPGQKALGGIGPSWSGEELAG